MTLLDGADLRGCVGTIKAARQLHEAVVDIATVAALHDNGFPPVRREEVSRLTVQVSVLSAPRPLGSWRDLELGRHGVVLARQGAAGERASGARQRRASRKHHSRTGPSHGAETIPRRPPR